MIGEVLDLVRAMHDRLWDDDAGLVRLAPGATPGLDLRPLGLHAIRETALGALLDLGDGRTDRAVRALDAMLVFQYDAPGTPWDGTFKVTAEEPDPPGGDAVEWQHYDPNWRQFLGTALAMALEGHEPDLPPGLSARVGQAAERCARLEPDDRIAEWYTNPNLLHAWLQAWVGARVGDPTLLQAGEARAAAIVDRFDRLGDVDEYNSPTYDGIDLLALGLWVAHPPAPRFGPWGQHLLAALGERIAALYHPPTTSMCGPYARAYGIGLDRYVSLIGLWLVLAGQPELGVLPPVLDEHTVHAHDLFFAPAFATVAPSVVPHLAGVAASVPTERRQTFGDVTAASRLDGTTAAGAARGPVPAFARDQFVPLTVHHRGPAGVTWIGVKLGADAEQIDASTVDGRHRLAEAVVRRRSGADQIELRILCSEAPKVEPGSARIGDLVVEFDPPPDGFSIEHAPDAVVLALVWPVAQASLGVRSVGAA